MKRGKMFMVYRPNRTHPVSTVNIQKGICLCWRHRRCCCRLLVAIHRLFVFTFWRWTNGTNHKQSTYSCVISIDNRFERDVLALCRRIECVWAQVHVFSESKWNGISVAFFGSPAIHRKLSGITIDRNSITSIELEFSIDSDCGISVRVRSFDCLRYAIVDGLSPKTVDVAKTNELNGRMSRHSFSTLWAKWVSETTKTDWTIKRNHSICRFHIIAPDRRSPKTGKLLWMWSMHTRGFVIARARVPSLILKSHNRCVPRFCTMSELRTSFYQFFRKENRYALTAAAAATAAKLMFNGCSVHTICLYAISAVSTTARCTRARGEWDDG